MRALIAFDKFKDSLTASAACAVATEALRECQPSWQIESAPLADGGEGFASILTHAVGGELRTREVTGPRGARIQAAYGLVSAAKIPAGARGKLGPGLGANAKVAVVEMAAASGLALLSPAERDVWQTTTMGTGELIAMAATEGADAIVLGVGGSATNDLGLGALMALGLRAVDDRGNRVQGAPIPAIWPQVQRLDGKLQGLPPVFIACDVTNPLLGARGAAAVYGPQKGLRREDLSRLDHETARLALLLCTRFGQSDAMMDQPGAGAAGGIAFGLMVAAGAKLLPGFDFVAEWLDLSTRIAGADVVITGEGRFDDSSLSGKGPGAIAAQALARKKEVHVFAGSVTTHAAPHALSLHAINPPNTPLSQAIRDTEPHLRMAIAKAFAAE